MSNSTASADHRPRVTPEVWIEVLTQPSTDVPTAGLFENNSRNTAYRRRETGELPAFKAGAQWRVPTEFLLQRAGLTTPEARAAALRRAREELAAQRQVCARTATAQHAERAAA